MKKPDFKQKILNILHKDEGYEDCANELQMLFYSHNEQLQDLCDDRNTLINVLSDTIRKLTSQREILSALDSISDQPASIVIQTFANINKRFAH